MSRVVVGRLDADVDHAVFVRVDTGGNCEQLGARRGDRTERDEIDNGVTVDLE